MFFKQPRQDKVNKLSAEAWSVKQRAKRVLLLPNGNILIVYKILYDLKILYDVCISYSWKNIGQSYDVCLPYWDINFKTFASDQHFPSLTVKFLLSVSDVWILRKYWCWWYNTIEAIIKWKWFTNQFADDSLVWSAFLTKLSIIYW